MSQPACSRYREDLALLAGGDLPSGPERSAAESHAAGCDACARLLAALGGDLALVARAARQPDPQVAAASLVNAVLAHAAAEAVADGLYRPAAAPRRSDLGLAAFGRVAAAIALVAAAGFLGVSLLTHEQSQGPVAQVLEPAASPAAPAPQVAAADPVSLEAPAPGAPEAVPASPAFRPVRVHRAAGNAVTLEWEGDGRESVRDGGSKPYTVLASASARDFSKARPVLVAGRSLVSNDQLPALRRGDRSLTFFRVE
jgi:hypothetical protein